MTQRRSQQPDGQEAASKAGPAASGQADAGQAPPDPLARPEAAARWALFLDVDGTLLAFQGRPEAVQLHASLRDVLAELAHRMDRAVALVSGRTLSDLDRLQAPLSLPAAGLHGLERRRADGASVQGQEGAALDHIRMGLGELVGGYAALWLEDKGRALAVHYRADPGLRDMVLACVRALCAAEGTGPDGGDGADGGDDADGLMILDGKMVCEIKPRHADKGSAIRAFMAEPPFAGRVPVFLGDDVTDEDGFKAVNALGGLSIRVGEGATVAVYRLPDEPAVEAWLGRVRDAVAEAGLPRQQASHDPTDRR
jgi:trehalose 6-phosphate phosphatase